jgi:hypothetical protein
MLSDDYGNDEVGQILAEAHSGVSLEELHCPRDRARLRVYFSQFRSDDPGAEVEGVLHGDWGDVREISVECPTCGTWRARISLRRGRRRRSGPAPKKGKPGE